MGFESTGYGQKFFDSQVPKIMESLKDISSSLQEIATQMKIANELKEKELNK